MPRRIEKKIQAEYIKKGKSPKAARRIAFATMNKKGLLRKR